MSMACKKAKRSWRVRIVTSVTGRLPPTPSMQSLHKLRPVFPPHMASIGGYCCCCCCVCSSDKNTHTHTQKKKKSRRSSTNLIMKSVTGKQIELAVSLSRGYFCGACWIGRRRRDGCVVLSWFLEKSLSVYVHACVCSCVCLCVNRPVFKVSLQRQQGKLFTTWLVVKSKYASVGAYQRLLHLVPG